MYKNIINKNLNATNGNFYTSDTDLSLKEVGFDFSIKRFYNSTRQTTGYLGTGWRLNCESQLEIKNNDQRITIVRDNGKKSIYDYSATENVYRSIEQGNETVTKNSDGTYTLTLASKNIFIYNALGKLIKKEDKNGNSQTFSYTGPLLTKIQNDSGASLSFNQCVL